MSRSLSESKTKKARPTTLLLVYQVICIFLFEGTGGQEHVRVGYTSSFSFHLHHLADTNIFKSRRVYALFVSYLTFSAPEPPRPQPLSPEAVRDAWLYGHRWDTPETDEPRSPCVFGNFSYVNSSANTTVEPEQVNISTTQESPQNTSSNVSTMSIPQLNYTQFNAFRSMFFPIKNLKSSSLGGSRRI